MGLKCPNCGGALPENAGELQKCPYCGMTVNIDDANRYLEYLKGFIVEWMNKALPLGVGIASSSSVDALARHNIFVLNILPRLDAEFGTLQINAYEAFSKPLIAPPFVKYPHSTAQFGDTKSLFSYDAKIEAIQPFAVSDEDQANVQKMGGMARAFAHVLIGLDILNQNILNQNPTGAYKLAAENYLVASKSLEPQYDIISKRLQALSDVYLAIADLFSKTTIDAKSKLSQAVDDLNEVKAKSALDLNLSISTEAIEEEIEVANAISRIADIMDYGGTGDQLDVFSRFGEFFKSISAISLNAPPIWRTRFENLRRYGELAKWFSSVLEAKGGKPSVRLTSGPGNILFPFWVAEVRYTFGTGALWMKKGVVVNDNALVAATFPLNPTFDSTPSDVITDIFSERPGGKMGSSITGSEASISVGASISQIVKNASLSSVSGYKVVPSLSTASEAQQLMNEYIQLVSRREQGKMQIASSNITDLLFVPADFSAGSLSFRGTLGYLQPKNVGDASVISSLLT